MKAEIHFTFFFALLLAGQDPAPAQSTAAIYADWLANPATSKLIDYSYAGYHNGKCLPPVISGPVFKVTDYGAIANDNKDDINAIQRTVDAACRNGGGVVLFPAGVFDFDLNYPAPNPNVRIWGSNVVIRGAGSGSGGTVLQDHKGNNGGDWTTMKLPNFFSFSSVDMHYEQELWYPNSTYSSTIPITTISPAARLSTVLTVAGASGLKTGQTYVITQADPDMSLVKAMSPGSPSYGARPSATGTDYTAMKYRQIVRIVAVAGSQITIDSPLAMELRSNWSPTLWPTEHPVIREVGLEDLQLKMDMAQPFVHHDGAAADYGNHHVRFDWVEDGWMRNVVQEGASSAILLRDSKNCVIYNSSIIGGEGHFGYQLCGTPSRNLFLNLDGSRQFHTFSIEGGVGNVFKDCKASDTAAIDLHGNVYGIYNLFDNIKGCVGAGGGDAKQVPPNHGIGFTMWNWQMGTHSPYSNKPQDVFVDVTAYNAYNAPGFIAAGVRAKDGHAVYYTDLAKARQTAPLNQVWGYAESIGAAVSPVSLYDAQKGVRLTYNWCDLVGPGDATVYALNTTVNILAEAGAAEGKTVSKVEFFSNGKSIGTDDSRPYSCIWTPPAGGAYTLTARMTASDNVSSASSPITVVAGEVRVIEDTSSAIAYKGTTQKRSNPSSSAGSDRWLAASSGEMAYSFRGTRIGVYTNLSPAEAQTWTIYLDGVKAYSPQRLPAVTTPGYLVWDSGNLPDGDHSIRCTSENGGSSFDYLYAVLTPSGPMGIPPSATGTASLVVYPNPTGRSVAIHYRLPNKSNVKISVYDISGKEVMRLLDERQGSGKHVVRSDVSSLRDGTYFVKMSMDGAHLWQQLIIKK